MEASVLAFRTRESETDIPTPLNYSLGKRYLRIDLPDETLKYHGFNAGASLIFQVSPPLNGLPHAICYGGTLHVGVIRFTAGRLRFIPWEAGWSEAVISERDVLGVLCESYPFGIPGPRLASLSELPRMKVSAS